MRAKVGAAIAAIVISLVGCSSQVELTEREDGKCYQERTTSFLGIDKKEGNIVNC